MLKPVTDRARISAVLQKYSLPDAYLLYLSTLQPRKNLERLVTAYANSGVALPLVLAGKQGWLSEGILATIEGLDSAVADRIFLPGFIDEDDKAALLSGATALLYPSLYEGFGFPLLEAQACATAVLAANSSSLPEIAGDSALLIDPLDVDAIATGIQQLVADEALRQRLVAAGAQNVARFTWSNSAERTFRLLLQAAQL